MMKSLLDSRSDRAVLHRIGTWHRAWHAIRHAVERRHDRGLYFVACEAEANMRYGDHPAGLSLWWVNAQCYVAGFIDRHAA